MGLDPIPKRTIEIVTKRDRPKFAHRAIDQKKVLDWRALEGLQHRPFFTGTDQPRQEDLVPEGHSSSGEKGQLTPLRKDQNAVPGRGLPFQKGEGFG